MEKKRIVITGMGLVSCYGTNIDHFYESLLAGKSGVVPITNFPCEEYPTRFAASVQNFETGDYLDKKHARRTDPFIRYTMVAGKKAIENSGLSLENLDVLDRSRCGVLIGSGMGGMSVFCEGNKTLLTKGHRRITPFFIPYIITNMGGALLAIDLGFKGPNYSISTACATSNYCITSAAQHIERGDADLMICGGTEAPITPIGVGGFVAIKALSQNNENYEKSSRPWDKARDGFVMGEGSGVLVLESLEHAKARGAPILAEYLGGAVNTDAFHMTNPREDGAGIAACMEEAIRDVGIAKEDINYINAHATATQVGDLCEIRGMRKVFKEHMPNIKINATKSMIGHCLGAAGGIEAIATIKSIQTGKLHPTINLENPEEEVADLDLVPNKMKEHQIKVAMSNSFGFGGHNSAILLAPYQEN